MIENQKIILLFFFIPLPILLMNLEGFFFFEENINFFKERLQVKEIFLKKEAPLFQEKKKEREEIITEIEGIIPKIENTLIKVQKFVERIEKERIQKIKEKSENIQGVYITSFTASSNQVYAQKLRNNILKLSEEKKINSVVIDVKEAKGSQLSSQLKKKILEFHQKNLWVIARIVIFRDSSLKDDQPELYLKSKSGGFWQDNQRCYWLDPASQEVQDYIISFSKKVIDYGFDELQFDYIRFPSDGSLKDIVYPFYDEKKERIEAISNFAERLNSELRDYKKEIVLSVDIFGYLATQFEGKGIGQKLKDFKDFDYISFMLYPSHFYGGFEEFPYESEDIIEVASNHPYEVVFRSIQRASDYLEPLGGIAKIRPWLQAFNLKADTKRGIFYDAEKITAQINAAQTANSSGFLLWDPENKYTFFNE